ncbi:hypothetical protein [Streptomyces glaucescens]
MTLKFAGGTTWEKTRRLAEPSAHADDLRQLAYQLMDAAGLQRGRLTGITLRGESASTTPARTGCSPSRRWTASATSSGPPPSDQPPCSAAPPDRRRRPTAVAQRHRRGRRRCTDEPHQARGSLGFCLFGHLRARMRTAARRSAAWLVMAGLPVRRDAALSLSSGFGLLCKRSPEQELQMGPCAVAVLREPFRKGCF